MLPITSSEPTPPTETKMALRKSESDVHGGDSGRPPLGNTRSSSSHRHSLLRSHSSASARALSGSGSFRNLTRSLHSSTRSLRRSMTSLLGSSEETFYCQICFENVALGDAFKLTACGHRFCRACLEQYLDSKISDAQLYPVCFHEDTTPSTDSAGTDASARDNPNKVCGVVIPQDDICAVVSVPTWRKYQTFLFNKTHQHARQCPYCDHSQDYPDGQEDPECTCEACGKTFCFHHSNAHVDSTCAEHEKRMAESERLDRAAISKIAKDCPGCGHPVEKNGGCNHMTCISCDTDFCWLCGAIVDKSVFPEHFQWWNVTGCPGAQMTETDDETLNVSWCSRALRMLYVLVLGVPAYILAAVLTVLSWPFPAFRRSVESNFRAGISSWLRTFMTCFMVIVALAGLVVVAALGIVLSPMIALYATWGVFVDVVIAFRDALYECVVDTETWTCTVCTSDSEMVRSGHCARGQCPGCSTEFCWLCGTFFSPRVPSDDDHFLWWHYEGCVKRAALKEDGWLCSQYLFFGIGWVLELMALIPAGIMMVTLWPWHKCRVLFNYSPGEMFNWALRKMTGVLLAILLLPLMVLILVVYLITTPLIGIATMCYGFQDIVLSDLPPEQEQEGPVEAEPNGATGEPASDDQQVDDLEVAVDEVQVNNVEP